MSSIARSLSVLLMPAWLVACVTINVYFPAAAAENAADRILEEVYGRQPGAEPPKTPAKDSKEPTSQRESGPQTPLAIRALELFVTPAQAAADIDISTPAIQAITNSLAQRRPSMEPYFNSGAIGMGTDGQVKIRDLNAVPLRERNQLQQLVAADNRDWNALYQEVAKANGHPEWEDEIRATFARRWVAKAHSGWWHQAGGSWKQK